MKRRSHRRIQCARAISSRNLTGDGTFAYAYDAENRLVSATSAAETNGAIRVLNAYDHRNRRIRKTVQRLRSTIALPPSPPAGIHEWETQETHTFVWDANNIVLEKVVFANGTTRTFEYFWGADKSGTEQGAGGVGGLLYLTVEGTIYIPCYDNNGNITCYLDANGNTIAQYTYDAFGNTISQSGPLAGFFRHRFSTKYCDSETGLYYYGYRFYHPILMRWLNRDPLEEDGGVNIYIFCGNSPTSIYDGDGLAYFAYRPLDSFLFRHFVIGNRQDEIDNTMIAHEQLFFEDDGIPTNLGFFDDNTVRIDMAGIPYRRPHSTGWNDCIMRKAVRMVKPRRYKLLDINLHNRGSQYNCQDWAEDVRRAYYCITHKVPYYPMGTTFLRSRP